MVDKKTDVEAQGVKEQSKVRISVVVKRIKGDIARLVEDGYLGASDGGVMQQKASIAVDKYIKEQYGL